jgi:hypothetical protein
MGSVDCGMIRPPTKRSIFVSPALGIYKLGRSIPSQYQFTAISVRLVPQRTASYYSGYSRPAAIVHAEVEHFLRYAVRPLLVPRIALWQLFLLISSLLSHLPSRVVLY